MKFKKVLRNDSIYLKQLIPKDVNYKYVSWLHNPYINKFLDVKYNPPSFEEQKEFVLQCLNSKDKILLGIYTKTDELIGTCKLTYIDNTNVEIGIMIGEASMMGLGIGKLTIELIKSWAIKQKIYALHAGYDIKNIASFKLFKSTGFIKYDIYLEFYGAEGEARIIERVKFVTSGL